MTGMRNTEMRKSQSKASSLGSLELNHLLISNLPQLKKRYDEILRREDGESTSPYVVYGDVLALQLESALKEDHLDDCKAFFGFIEKALALHDEKLENVIAVSVIENLYFSALDKEFVKKQLGPLALTIWKDYEK